MGYDDQCAIKIKMKHQLSKKAIVILLIYYTPIIVELCEIFEKQTNGTQTTYLWKLGICIFLFLFPLIPHLHFCWIEEKTNLILSPTHLQGSYCLFGVKRKLNLPLENINEFVYYQSFTDHMHTGMTIKISTNFRSISIPFVQNADEILQYYHEQINCA